MEWIERIKNWFADIWKLNDRLKQIEEMHSNKKHHGNICPNCGEHSIRTKIDSFCEPWRVGEDKLYQTKVTFCEKECGYILKEELKEILISHN